MAAGPPAAPVDPGTGNLVARARAALDSITPTGWTSTGIHLEIVAGSSSYAIDQPATIQVGARHATGGWAKLRFVLAHEWGHHVAFTHGNPAAGYGHGPASFPATGDPAEQWAHCVAETLVADHWQPVHGLGRCTAEQLTAVDTFLATPPTG